MNGVSARRGAEEARGLIGGDGEKRIGIAVSSDQVAPKIPVDQISGDFNLISTANFAIDPKARATPVIRWF